MSYWERGLLVFHNYATGAIATASPLATEILDFFDDWRPVEDLFARMPGFSRGSLRRALALLARHTFLQRSDRPRPSEASMEAWASWNPAAGFFHFSTKDVRFETRDARARRFIKDRLRARGLPAPVKRYPRTGSLTLPAPARSGPLFETLLARRTWRRFSDRPLPLGDLSTLLGLTFGVRGWMDLGELGRAPLKTSPSGGARHPIEAYLLARRVAGIPAGLYHYAADGHRLTPLRRGARRLVAYLGGQPWYARAAAVVFLTAVFARTELPYPYPRAYRVVLIEAGHLCQTFCVVATALGLAPFCSAALADSRLEKDLGVDGVTESVLYAAGVGIRPRGLAWAPWPGAPARAPIPPSS